MIKKFKHGEIYGELKIIGDTKRRKSLRVVECECTCGIVVTRTTRHLSNDSYCGRYKKHYIEKYSIENKKTYDFIIIFLLFCISLLVLLISIKGVY